MTDMRGAWRRRTQGSLARTAFAVFVMAAINSKGSKSNSSSAAHDVKCREPERQTDCLCSQLKPNVMGCRE